MPVARKSGIRVPSIKRPAREALKTYDNVSGEVYKWTAGLPSTIAHAVVNPDWDQLILLAKSERNIQELARLHKYAINASHEGLTREVEARCQQLNIPLSKLHENHPRQWNPALWPAPYRIDSAINHRAQAMARTGKKYTRSQSDAVADDLIAHLYGRNAIVENAEVQKIRDLLWNDYNSYPSGYQGWHRRGKRHNPKPAGVPKSFEALSIRRTAMDADDVKKALEADGIPAMVTEQHQTSTGQPISSPYVVWTPKKTYKRAVRLAEQAYFARHPHRNPKASGYFVPGLHGAKSPKLAGHYWTKAEAMKAAQRMANEEGETVYVMPPQGSNIPVHPRHSNPAEAADALYESFHGRAPEETVEIREEVHEHEHLTTLGMLRELVVDTVSGLRATITFEKEPYLASSEDGKQLYIEAGDQELDLKALKLDGDEWERDRMMIGQFSPPEPGATDKNGKRYWNLMYRTSKEFDAFEEIDYCHDLGEESGVRPFLEYDLRNNHLYITGGQYVIRQPLFETSPGIEN